MTNFEFNSMTTGNVMPLLMGFTPSTKIQEETNPVSFIYNDGQQIVMYDMRIIGTRSLKTSWTKNGVSKVTDRKNEIDDQKYVN